MTKARVRSVLRRIALTVLLLLVAYVVSIGPMAVLLLLPRWGQSGSTIWNIVYFEPLRRLPKPARGVVNWYMGTCSVTYYRHRPNWLK